MPTIYRKYRPQIFSDLIGQEYIIQTLTNEIVTNRIAQAYLFSGPRGVGKTTVARLLAKAVNCADRPSDSAEPCDKCTSCQEISLGRNVDVIEIDAASHTGVDNVRENIIENAQFRPTKSKYKVFIIDEVHMLSTSSFNALLKTLEEPPAHVIFILATTEPHKLPATVISRCQRFNFKKIPYDLMEKRLQKICQEEKIKMDKHVLGRIIAKSDGCLRDAESLLGQIFSLNLKKITEEDASIVLPTSDVEANLNFLEHLLNKDTSKAINLINSLVNEGIHLEQFTLGLLEMLRGILVVQAIHRTDTLNADYASDTLKKIKKMAADIQPPALIKLIEMTLSRRQELRNAPLPQLPLELLIVEFITSMPPNDAASVPPACLADATARRANVETLLEQETKDDAEPAQTLKDSLKAALSTITGKSSPPKTTMEEIKNKWEMIINTIAETNHSLIFILKMCDIKNIDEQGLRLTVPYPFHKEKLEENKNKKIIEGALAAVFGEKIIFNCEVVTESQKKTSATENEIISLATDFGGEIAR